MGTYLGAVTIRNRYVNFKPLYEYENDEYPARVIRALVADELAILRSMQGQERLVIGYAKELGLTPNARQRLAKKAADERPVTEEEELYGD